MTLDELIRDTRHKKRLTLKETAELAKGKVSFAHIQKLENGTTKNPSPHVLYFLAQALDLEYFRLMRLAGYIVTNNRKVKKS